MIVEQILLEGGTTAATLYIIWQLIKDRDKTIKDNTEALLANKLGLQQIYEIAKKLLDRSDAEAAADLSDRENKLQKREQQLNQRERNNNGVKPTND